MYQNRNQFWKPGTGRICGNISNNIGLQDCTQFISVSYSNLWRTLACLIELVAVLHNAM